MPYFLDGNNLIGRARGSARPTEEDSAALIREVAARLRRSRASAVIFFDGPGGQRPSALGSLSVRYPRSGSADDAILGQIGASRAPAEIVVVTWDRELARRARDAGAKWLDPDAFWERFGARRGRVADEAEPPPVDVEDWMKYFGGKGGGESGG